MSQSVPRPPADPGDSPRSRRFAGRQALRKVTNIPACRSCGRTSVLLGGDVGLRRTEAGVVGFAGLKTCGRIWVCPTCNAKVMAKRAIEIGAGLAWTQASGFNVLWGSLTVRHNAGSDLAKLIEIQTAAWRHIVNSKYWRSINSTQQISHTHTDSCDPDCDRKRDVILTSKPGRVGYIRASEITIGDNGWHPHFHPIIIVQGSKEFARAIAKEIIKLWIIGVGLAKGDALDDTFGAQKLTLIDSAVAFDNLGDYVTKATYSGFDPSHLALETVWSQGKTSAGKVSKTDAHWSLLERVSLNESSGEITAETIRWWELEEATTGHRMITWSRGLRQFAGIGMEKTDEEEAATEIGDKTDTVCFITREGWHALRDRADLLGLILDVLEHGGWDACRSILDAHNITWVPVGDDGLAPGRNNDGWEPASSVP